MAARLLVRPGTTASRRARLEGRLGALLLLVALSGIMFGRSTRAAFSDVSGNLGNAWTAGSVVIGDNDAGDLMLSLTDAKPGASTTACVKVTYNGSLPAAVRLHGTTTGTGLDQYLTLTITRGTYTSPEPQFASCQNFAPDATDYAGAGSGVVYNGTLQNFPDDFASGLVDPAAGSPAPWTQGDFHVYRLTIYLQDNSAAQGKNATQAFVWEARNS